MAQLQTWIKKAQLKKQSVTVGWVMRKYSLTCSPKTVRKRILKPMNQKWLHRSRKPGVPAN